MKKSIFILVVLCASFFSDAQTPLRVKLTAVAKGFTSPVGLSSPLDGTNRLFVVEQGGKIKIVKDSKVLPEPFLNVSSKLDGLNIAYSEKGLLGMAFHPDYKSNGKFYIYYSAPDKTPGVDHKGILAEYSVSKSNPDLAEIISERIILEVPEPESNHNGGQIAFGPDGYLYIGLGDGGGANDEHGAIGNGQNLNTWLGKILRIDIDSEKPYKVPVDNPFVGKENVKPEIWAYGLRNPWRFSFDKISKQLFCADVGQNKYEEINLIQKGKNYGWRIMEGYHCFNPAQNCDRSGLTPPVCEYNHDEGVSVTGGYMHRGKENPILNGFYFFGDWSGKLWSLNYNTAQKEWIRRSVFINDSESNETDGKINSFGEDENGNVYVVTQRLFGPRSPTGVIYKISK